MKIIEINEIKDIIKESPLDMNLMFLGDTGIGKTTVINNYAKENGCYLVTLILAHLDPSKALGVPYPKDRIYNGNNYKEMSTAIPSWVFDLADHVNDKNPPILFLDEFLCAEPAVANSFLNFLSEKKVEGIDLSRVKIIGASNISNYTYDPDKNILTRFCFFWAKNSTYNEFNNNDKFNIAYKDETPDENNIIFSKRELKPRCLEMMMKVNNQKYVDYFYEGYTNTQPSYKVRVSRGINDSDKINFLMSSFVSKEDPNKIDMNQKNVIASIFLANFRKSYIQKVFDSLFRLNNDEKNQIMEIINNSN